MEYAYFTKEENSHYPVVILANKIQKDEFKKEYMSPFALDDSSVIAIKTEHDPKKKKTPKKDMVSWVTEELAPTLADLGTAFVICSDSEYFKVLTDTAKAQANLGYVLKSPYGEFHVVYVPSVRSIFYDPESVRSQINQGISALKDFVEGSYEPPGESIIQFEDYPETDNQIQAWLGKLLEMDCPLSIDIEAFSLKPIDAGIGSISFAWNKNSGISFLVDYVPEVWEGTILNKDGKEQPATFYGRQVRNEKRREMLRNFFIAYLNKQVYHNISYDVMVLIYQLFMRDITDTVGLLQGLEIMLRNWDDTKLITYLATNSCAGNELSLKIQAQEFAGNYAQDNIKDIRLIKPKDLLKYNLVDSYSTWFVHEKHHQTMLDDKQEDIYLNLFKPAIKDIIQMQLTGMPLSMPVVLEVEEALQAVVDDAIERINATTCVQKFQYTLKEKYIEKKHAQWKKKRITLDEVPEEVRFNPRSPLQLQALLYDQEGLPVISLTDTKQPSCDADTIEKLSNHDTTQDVKDLLRALLDFAAVDKIVGTFIPAFKLAPQGSDGWWYLIGNFNLGGTVSGRLSSSEPNLQNLPASVTMKISEHLLERFPILKKFTDKGKLSLGKLVKYCFQAPPGYIFIGLDFASLEDRISALTTRDPNKIKVYTDGYDGHAMRAVAYWPSLMPDIDPTSVESVNQVAQKGHKYEALRGKSKAPTFAMTYQGTWLTLVKNCGFTPDEAKEVEARYQALYQVSIDWVNAKLDQASKDGYITAAFGLRVRTPLLAQVVRGNSKTPKEAQAEGRTAGNALGQSWCLLNSRAASEFMGKVRQSQYKHKIRPCAHIHDAQYYLIPDDIDVLVYVNEHLVQAVKWQNHPDIYHPQVGLGGEVSIFYPTWAKEIEIPNGATQEEIIQRITEKT